MANELLVEIQAVRSMLHDMSGKWEVDAVSAAQTDRLLELARRAQISLEECPALLAEVSQCNFPAAASGRLMQIISQRAGSHVHWKASSNRPKLQDYTSLGHYFMQAQWESMKSGSDPLRTIIHHAAKLGLRLPSEPTWQMVTAIYLLVQNIAAAANALSPHDKNQVLKHVKKMGRRMLTAGDIVIAVLPGMPEEFRKRTLTCMWRLSVLVIQSPIRSAFVSGCLHRTS